MPIVETDRGLDSKKEMKEEEEEEEEAREREREIEKRSSLPTLLY